MIVCGSLKEIETAIWQHYPQAEMQLCTIHLARNIEKHIKPKHKSEVASDLKEVFKAVDSRHSIERAKKKWEEFCCKWGKHYPSIAQKANSERMELYFTYLKYDYRVQSRLYSTNWIERLNRDYKRTTRMRGALPNPDATILLLEYVAMTRSAFQRKIPNLMYENERFSWES